MKKNEEKLRQSVAKWYSLNKKYYTAEKSPENVRHHGKEMLHYKLFKTGTIFYIPLNTDDLRPI